MNPAQSISSVFGQYLGFSGRACRSEYWWFLLFQFIVEIILLIAFPILYVIFFLGTILPYLAVAVRRLHDTGRSGWWMLIGLVPFIGGVFLLVFFVSEGEWGDNKYGPDPQLSPDRNIGSSGAPRIEGSGGSPSDSGLCTTCGSGLYSGANFCRSCGSAV